MGVLPSWTPDLALLKLLACVLVALALGSLIRLVSLRRASAAVRRDHLSSLGTWWVLAILVAVALLAGKRGVTVLFAVASGLAMREYVRLVRRRPADRPAVLAVYLAVPLHYGLIFFDVPLPIVLASPVALLILLATVQLLNAETKGFIRGTAELFWGAMVLVYGLSFTALVTTVPVPATSAAGPLGWFLYLVLLTETNDIAQALTGRWWGGHQRHRITARVSPHKTWEGFGGGLAVTVLLAAVLAPPLAPLHHQPVRYGSTEWRIPYFWPVFIGLTIAFGGFLGDINMSAVKRDAGVKDSSRLLPGMGGMIDRIDSLTFAAPVFYFLLIGVTG